MSGHSLLGSGVPAWMLAAAPWQSVQIAEARFPAFQALPCTPRSSAFSSLVWQRPQRLGWFLRLSGSAGSSRARTACG